METHVHIVGPLKVQNELLASFLEKEAGLYCVPTQNSDLAVVVNQKTNHTILILWDCMEVEPETLWTDLTLRSNNILDHCLLALFNVSPGMGIEHEAAKRGVRGIFYKDTPLEILAKGVQAIINRKLWFSRDTMTELFLEARDLPMLSRELLAPLSPREKEILLLIASGSNNGQIGERLCISENTVKTHTTSIYKKINVPNRLQAALWVMRNL